MNMLIDLFPVMCISSFFFLNEALEPEMSLSASFFCDAQKVHF